MPGKLLTAAALASLAAASTGASAATVVYSNDFNSGLATSFTGTTAVTTAPDNAHKFLGILTNSATATLALSGLAAHSSVTLSFDVYGLRSLDGGFTCCGPDKFTLNKNGSQVFSEKYGWEFILGSAGAPVTGTAYGGGLGTSATYDANGFGYGNFYTGATTVHYSLTFADTASAITFAFIGATDQGWSDEGFGLDNVVVSIASAAPEPASTTLLLAALGLLGMSGRRKTA